MLGYIISHESEYSYQLQTVSPLTSAALQPLKVPGLLLLPAELLPLVHVDYDRLLQGPQLRTEVT